jgi:hypothetical protein
MVARTLRRLVTGPQGETVRQIGLAHPFVPATGR